ncbi:hypothetical protein Ndes2526B_g04259 [Nannochloris sp. 'desiccata']
MFTLPMKTSYIVPICQKVPNTPISAVPSLLRLLPTSSVSAASGAPPRRIAVLTAATISGRENSKDNGKDEPKSLRSEAQQSNQEVYDRLIDVFMSRSSEEWRKLIAHSSQWPILSEGVLIRMEERAVHLEKNEEDEARRLRRNARRLKSISDELGDYGKLVTKFRESPSAEWESMVALHRNSLASEFFNYIELRVRAAASTAAAAGEETSGEAEALAALGTQVAALVEAHDRVLADEGALDSAAERFSDLLSSETMEAAEAKIDELASSGKLDPALLLTMAKAYAGVKETDVTQEEVKDIMAHLYFKAKESFAQQAPPEARILKFLLAVESPTDRLSLMEQSFQPGPQITTSDEDFLFTTPDALLNTIENVLTMYNGAKGGGGGGVSFGGNNSVTSGMGMGMGSGPSGMASQAAALMNPEVIERLRELQQTIRKQYL